MVQTASPPAQEQRIAMSYEEFLAYGDDTTHAEWVDGEVIVFMAATIAHQDLSGFWSELLRRFTRKHQLGKVLYAPTEMRTRPDGPAREPDIFFVATQHLDRFDGQRLNGPADFVLEIVSESSTVRDRIEKFVEYQTAGIPEYLILDPRTGWQRVDFYALDSDGKYQAILPDAGGRYHSSSIPGFWFREDWSWQDPLPDPDDLLPLLFAERGA
jgi:Uma2 family endonuclease